MNLNPIACMLYRAGVEKLQTLYVKYSNRNAQIANRAGWELQSSRRNYEQIARTENQPFMPDDLPLFSNLAPEYVSMRIVESPAEFAVPVKQDRWVPSLQVSAALFLVVHYKFGCV